MDRSDISTGGNPCLFLKQLGEILWIVAKAYPFCNVFQRQIGILQIFMFPDAEDCEFHMAGFCHLLHVIADGILIQQDDAAADSVKVTVSRQEYQVVQF